MYISDRQLNEARAQAQELLRQSIPRANATASLMESGLPESRVAEIIERTYPSDAAIQMARELLVLLTEEGRPSIELVTMLREDGMPLNQAMAIRRMLTND